MITPLSPQAAETWRLLADRAASEQNPRLRANLEVVARHVEAEVRGDVPALMASAGRMVFTLNFIDCLESNKVFSI